MEWVVEIQSQTHTVQNPATKQGTGDSKKWWMQLISLEHPVQRRDAKNAGEQHGRRIHSTSHLSP